MTHLIYLIDLIITVPIAAILVLLFVFLLQKLSPLCVICELPNTYRYSFQELQRTIGHPDIFVNLREERNGKMKCILKGIEQNEVEMVKAVMILANMYQLQVCFHNTFILSLRVEIPFLTNAQ